jgi:hypothetical protein
LRALHLIRSNEVDTWLADSVNRRVTYHRTTRIAAQDIFEAGIDISKSRIGAYGQGFYTATDPSAFPGDTLLAVAVRTRHPLAGDAQSIGAQVDALAWALGARDGRLTPEVAAGIRREIVRRGHDGMIIWDGGGDGIDYIVALDASTVKVVWQ